MTDFEKTLADTKAVAEEHSKPGKFNLLDRVLGRNYPTEDVEVYLDEAVGYRLQNIAAEILNSQDAERISELEAERDELREKAAESRLIFHLEGISVEQYDRLVDYAREEYPLEYIESRNPLTMKLERELKENEDREQFFRIQLWTKFIRKVTDASGAVEDEITDALVAALMGSLPLIAIARIQFGIERLRMTTDWMDEIQGADFLVKS